jgi:hypothetical protein
MDIAALVAKARESFDSVEPVDQDILMGDEVVTVRFWPVTGSAWRALTAEHPARPKVVMDQNLGYNLDAVTRSYPNVYLVQGDDVVKVSDPLPRKLVTDPEKRPWFDVVDSLSGPDLKNLASAVWGLNEYDPAKRLAHAGKASAGGRKKKPS